MRTFDVVEFTFRSTQAEGRVLSAFIANFFDHSDAVTCIAAQKPAESEHTHIVLTSSWDTT